MSDLYTKNNLIIKIVFLSFDCPCGIVNHIKMVIDVLFWSCVYKISKEHD